MRCHVQAGHGQAEPHVFEGGLAAIVRALGQVEEGGRFLLLALVVVGESTLL